MGRKMMLAALVPLLGAHVVAAKSGSTEIFEPASPWNIDYGDNACRLARIFGSGDKSVAFYIEKYGISTDFTVLMAGHPLKSLAEPMAQIEFSNGGGALRLTDGEFGNFGPSVVATDGTLNPGQLASTKAEKVYYASSDADYRQDDPGDPADKWVLTPAQMHEITWVALRRDKHSLRLNTGPLDKPMSALDACVDDLVKSWGLDPAKLRNVRQTPRPDIRSIQAIARAIQEHYPSKALRAGAQATISVRLIIDTTGHVADCQVIDVTQAKDFNNFACTAFEKNGRFKPALDENGTPVKSVYSTNVVYRIS